MLRKDLKLDDNLNDQSKKINIPSESYEKYFYEKLPNKFRLKNINYELSLVKYVETDDIDGEDYEDWEKRYEENFYKFETISTDKKLIKQHLIKNNTFDLGGISEDKNGVYLKIKLIDYEFNISGSVSGGEVSTDEFLISNGQNWGNPQTFELFQIGLQSENFTFIDQRILKPGIQTQQFELYKSYYGVDVVLVDWKVYQELQSYIWLILFRDIGFNLFWIPSLDFLDKDYLSLSKTLLFLNLLQVFEFNFAKTLMTSIKDFKDLSKFKTYEEFLSLVVNSFQLPPDTENFPYYKGASAPSFDEYSIFNDKNLITKPLEIRLPDPNDYKRMLLDENLKLYSITLSKNLSEMYDDLCLELCNKSDMPENVNFANDLHSGRFIEYVQFVELL